MYELKRTYLSCREKAKYDFVYNQYNETIEKLHLSDEPEAYLMYLRFMEEFLAFHEKVDKNNKTTYEVKIIYNKEVNKE